MTSPNATALHRPSRPVVRPVRAIPALAAASLLALALAGCGAGTPEPAESRPLDTSMQRPTVGDTSQPVASGNTPQAADVAAMAALNAQYDPARDPARDLETALVEAKRGGKRVVLELGGQWCETCKVLDDLIDGDAELRSQRDANFVWVKVNFSQENENKAFLAQYPAVTDYPHLYVLDQDGKLVQSQPVADFARGKGFDRAKVLAFEKTYAPTVPGAPAAAPTPSGG